MKSTSTSLPHRLFSNRNFMLLWAAYTVSALGDHLSEMAILQNLDALNKDVEMTSIKARMTFLLFVPFLVFGPLNGWLADRLPRRAVMVSADLCRCAILLMFTSLISGCEQLLGTKWGSVAPIMFIGVFASMFSPARAALVPTLINRSQLVRANGMIAGMGIIATMTALLVGGWLADINKPPVFAFRLDAFTFSVSAILLLLMKPPKQHLIDGHHIGNARSSRIKDQLKDGFRYVHTHRPIREMLMIAAVVWFCGACVSSVIPAVVRDVYGGTYADIGIYLAYLGVGFILGAAVMIIVAHTVRHEVVIILGLMGIAVSILILATSVFLPFQSSTLGRIGATGIIGAGFFGVMTMAAFNAQLQSIIPDRFRGRVFGVKDVFTTGALLLATGTLGIPSWTNLDAWVGYILVLVAVITFATGANALRHRFRRSPHSSRFLWKADILEFFVRFWWRLTVDGAKIPIHGPLLVTSNHTCYADPLFIYAAARHRMFSFMVAKEYCHLPFVHACVTSAECIPVNRDGQDSGPTREVIRRLRDGKAIGIFIEGRIVPPGETAEPRDGVAMLALRTGTPVIPIHISGTKYKTSLIKSFLTRHRAHVRIGKPVDLSEFRGMEKERDALSAATDKIYGAIQALAPIENTTKSTNH